MLKSLKHAAAAAAAAALQADFRYQPVLAHKSATSIHRTHSNASTYLEVFSITGYNGSEYHAIQHTISRVLDYQPFMNHASSSQPPIAAC
jgi:hypothetical protein